MLAWAQRQEGRKRQDVHIHTWRHAHARTHTQTHTHTHTHTHSGTDREKRGWVNTNAYVLFTSVSHTLQAKSNKGLPPLHIKDHWAVGRPAYNLAPLYSCSTPSHKEVDVFITDFLFNPNWNCFLGGVEKHWATKKTKKKHLFTYSLFYLFYHWKNGEWRWVGHTHTHSPHTKFSCLYLVIFLHVMRKIYVENGEFGCC